MRLSLSSRKPYSAPTVDSPRVPEKYPPPSGVSSKPSADLCSPKVTVTRFREGAHTRNVTPSFVTSAPIGYRRTAGERAGLVLIDPVGEREKGDAHPGVCVGSVARVVLVPASPAFIAGGVRAGTRRYRVPHVPSPCISKANACRKHERHVFCVGLRMDRIEHTRGEQWEFRCELSGAWRWCRRAEDGRLMATSAASFNSLRAAIADAASSGFSYTSTALEC